MRILQSLAIVIAGVLISGAILHSDRYQVLNDTAAFYLIHDTWGGDLTGCTLAGVAPDVQVSCAPVTR